MIIFILILNNFIEIMGYVITSLVLIFSVSSIYAQFTGEVGSSNCEAIHKDSPGIIAWAKTSSIQRGYLDKAAKYKGFVSQGNESNAEGAADNKVVSLGDSGVALLTFDVPIRNNLGPDFLVFENGFSSNYLELAFVEVSSDGIHFFRFPAISNRSILKQIGPYDTFGEVDGLLNLAGKYEVNYGTPFDINELPDTSVLDKFNIRYVKVIDVVGSIDSKIGSKDVNGRLINDPYPTDFSAGGFDLDAVAVFDNSKKLSVEDLQLDQFYVFPNPASRHEILNLKVPNFEKFEIINLFGQVVFTGTSTHVLLNQFTPGYYTIHLITHSKNHIRNLLITE